MKSPGEFESGMKKTLLSAAIVLFVLCGLLAGVWHALTGAERADIQLRNDADMVAVRLEISPELNAYTYFQAAAHVFTDISREDKSRQNDYLAGKPVDEVAIADILDRSEAAIKTLRRGLKCNLCIVPELHIENWSQWLLGIHSPSLETWRDMGRTLATSIRRHRLAGRYAEAADACVDLLRFGHLMQAQAETIPHYLSGLKACRRGLKQIRDMARDENVAAGELARLAEMLAEFNSFEDGIVFAFKKEYGRVARVIDEHRGGELDLRHGTYEFGIYEYKHLPAWMKEFFWGTGYAFHPNRTKNALAETYREAIANAALAYADMVWTDAIRWHDVDENRLLSQLGICHNMVGIGFHRALTGGDQCLLRIKCQTESEWAATRLIVALHLHRRETGEFPGELASLTPGLMPSIPNDPFDGKPFRYVASMRILYSVGANLQDNGGSRKLASYGGEVPALRRWEAEDAVFDIVDRGEAGR